MSMMVIDDTELVLNQTDLAAKYMAISKNEIRQRTGFDEATEEDLKAIEDEWKASQTTPLMFSNAQTLTDTRVTETPVEESQAEKDIKEASKKLAEDVILALRS